MIELAYGGGRFRGDAVLTTAHLLGVMGLGIVPFGIVFSLPRRLQALGKYSVQARLSFLLFGLNLALKLILTNSLGSMGVALSTVVAYGVIASLYFVYLWTNGLLLFPAWGLRWIASIGFSTVLVTLVLRYVVGPYASWWVPFACFAAVWGLMFALVGRELMQELGVDSEGGAA